MDAGSTRGALTPRSTGDAGAYLARVGKFLRQRPVEHVALLNAAAARAEAIDADDTNLWLWVEDEDGVLAAARAAPLGVSVSTGPAEAIRLLAQTVKDLRPGISWVAGPCPSPEAFAAEWERLGGPPATPTMHQGVYVANTVAGAPHAPGRMRPATRDDVTLLSDWAERYVQEVGLVSPAQNLVQARIDAGLLFVWELDGEVVSMAAVTAEQTGVSCVLLVYTPPQHRTRGFASACVHALTARELAVPGRTCMLYTDLANPTSNHIYQAIGYRRVGDATHLTFADSEIAD